MPINVEVGGSTFGVNDKGKWEKERKGSERAQAGLHSGCGEGIEKIKAKQNGEGYRQKLTLEGTKRKNSLVTD